MSELFDDASNYDAMLTQGIKLSGEDKHFFIRGRVAHLRSQLPPGLRVQRVLDFGCGVGDASAVLAEAFPGAHVVGVDVAEAAVERAQVVLGGDALQFGTLGLLREVEPFDLCYINGAFHHIPPGERAAVMATVHDAVRPGGAVAVFENNPWSVPARLVMRRIPFDADAAMLRARHVRKLLRDAGLGDVYAPRFLFVFPRQLQKLRVFERFLERLPIGAQYGVLAIR